MKNPQGKIKASLSLVARDRDGKVIGKVCKDDDMILKQFADIILFGLVGHSNAYTSDTYVTSKSEDGAAQTVRIFRTDATSFIVGSTESRRKIVIGTGTTAPVRTDFVIETPYANSEAVSVAQTAGYVSFVAAIDCPTAATITEAGLSNKYNVSGVGLRWFLLLRDTFDGIDVPEGGTLTVSYKVYI